MNKKLFWLLILSTAFFSCKKQLYQFGISDRKKLNVQEIDFEYFQARSKIKYLDGSQSINATANIRIKNDSIIWISLTPAIGIEIFRTIITPDSIYMIDRLNKVFQGISLDSIRQKMNFGFSYSMLESMLLGNLVIPRRNSDNVIRDGKYYHLKHKEGRLSVDNLINAKSMKIEKVSIVDDTTRNYLKVAYHNFQDIDSVFFAFDNSISLYYSDDDRSINTQVIITHTRVSFTEKKIKFPFNIPERYDPKDN